MSSHTGQYFDIKKKKQYIGNWCLFKRCYESQYTKIYVIDIVDNLIKYKYSNNDREIIEDIREFETTTFFISPFKSDKYIDTSEEL